MADGSEDLEIGPSYKTLFLGACIVVGGGFGWWAQDVKQSISRVYDAIEKVDARLADLETGRSENRWEIENLKREAEDVRRQRDEMKKRLADMEYGQHRRER